MNLKRRNPFFLFLILILLLFVDTSWAGAGIEIKNLESRINRHSLFRDLIRDLGREFSIPPDCYGPSLGLGFRAGLNLTLHNIRQDEEYWVMGVKDGSPPSILRIVRAYYYQGLPLDFDIGIVYSYPPGSNLHSAGVDLKWSFIEGTPVAPTVCLKGSLSHVFGINGLMFNIFGANINISHTYRHFELFGGVSHELYLADYDQGNLHLSNDGRETSLFMGFGLPWKSIHLTLSLEISGISLYDLSAWVPSLFNIKVEYIY